MKKEYTICFRTSKDIKNSLGNVAKRKRQTLSSVIEDVLYHYLKENKAFKAQKQERRAFTRREVSLPAFVYEDDTKKTKEFETGTIMDISLCGLLISVPKGAKLEISEDSKTNEFHIVFILPEFQRPIKMTCQPQRVAESEEAVQIGAAFVDSDFQSCQILQKYLI
jgi:predicted transcriptional regulator